MFTKKRNLGINLSCDCLIYNVPYKNNVEFCKIDFMQSVSKVTFALTLKVCMSLRIDIPRDYTYLNTDFQILSF